MKSSKFNIFFPYEKNHVGFNGYTQEFILLDPLLYDMYSGSERSGSFEELYSVHPDFYEFLVQQGFLVSPDLNEFEEVKKLSRMVDEDDSHFSLTINPTMNCNFKCWYCYETHIKDSKMDSETIAATLAFITKILSEKKELKSFSISFFGGEPLLYFDKVIAPILKESYKMCQQNKVTFFSGMTTNGLLLTDKILDTCSANGLTGFQITLDGYRDQHDKIRFISEGRGSYDKIVSNIKLVVKHKLQANVRINCSEDTLVNLNNIMDDFSDIREDEKRFINFDFHKVWQITTDIEPVMNDSRFHFRNQGFSVRGGIYDTVVNSCYADKRNSATINYNGDVFKCTARDFRGDSKEGSLDLNGEIKWNEKHEHRLNSKFKNAPCRDCKILPLCGGGCSQQALEHEGLDYCIHNFDEDAKLQLVKNKFLAALQVM